MTIFDRMIGGAEVTTDNDLKQRIAAAAQVINEREFEKALSNWRDRRVQALALGKEQPPKPCLRNPDNSSRSAYGAWLLIQSEGWEACQGRVHQNGVVPPFANSPRRRPR